MREVRCLFVLCLLLVGTVACMGRLACTFWIYGRVACRDGLPVAFGLNGLLVGTVVEGGGGKGEGDVCPCSRRWLVCPCSRRCLARYDRRGQ